MMKLRDIYERAVAAGIENDPRGREEVRNYLESRKKEYEDLKEKDREYFDKESLKNPYADSRVLYGDPDTDVKTALVGIDMETPELLLASQLSSKGKKIDLALAHHPEGRPFANLYKVMSMQADILGRFGVPINIAEDLTEGRLKDIERRLMPVNHTRAVDAAKLLNMPFACFHTLADNMVSTFLQVMFDQKAPYTLNDIMDLLLAIPEYQDARRNGAGPNILLGSGKRKAGKVFVDMTGGTEGAKEIFQSMATSNINTVVGMHFSDEHRKEAEKYHLNLIVAGHISSDNLGVNLLLDQIMKGGKFEVVECSGFRRVERG